MPERHLSSLVVHARPERLDAVAAALVAEGCEIHGRSAAGKLAVTLEVEGAGALADAITRIQLLPGVLAATLVFHHAEDADPVEETPA